MAKIVYRLIPDKTIDLVYQSKIYDVDEDCFTKNDYIKAAQKYTKDFNKEMGVNYTWQELFGLPRDIGWRYCSKCGCYFWKDDGCDCDE